MNEDFLSDSSEFDEQLAKPSRDNSFDSLGLDLDVKRRLTQYFSSVERGNDAVLTTPLGKDRELKPDDILKLWDDIFEANSHKINSELMHLEMSNKSKFGPRSIAKPWKELKSSVDSYFKADQCSVPSRFIYPSRMNQGRKFRPISIDKAIDGLKNNTNSGLPYFTRKSVVKKKVKSKLDLLLAKKYPCILFTRTQEGNKTRVVWGYPIADTVLEQQYYRPLLDFQRKLNWRSAIVGPDEVDRKITNLIRDRDKISDPVILSIDFSSYDSSIGRTVQNAAFNYIKDLFQNDYRKDIDFIKDRFSTISILTPSGIINGVHGVPSGSTFTNEVDSISQFLIAMSSGCVTESNCQIQGDDGVYLLSAEDVQTLVGTFERAGLSVNKDKSLLAKDYCVYLQNLYHNDYQSNGLVRGVYPTYRALGRIIYQERWSKFEEYDLEGKDYYSIRTYSILENCKHHPLFEEFVRFIYELDKYQLKVSRGSEKKYIKYMDSRPDASGFSQNQRGSDVSGLRNFQSYKIVQRIRS